MAEVLVLCGPGMGHYNPCVQLARAVAAYGGSATVFTYLSPQQLARAGVERVSEETCLWRELEPRVRLLCEVAESESMVDVIRATLEATDRWVERVKAFYRKPDCSSVLDSSVTDSSVPDSAWPSLVVADIGVSYDSVLAQYFRAPSYSFSPSPLYYALCDEALFRSVLNPCQVELPGICTLQPDEGLVLDPALLPLLAKAMATEEVARANRAGVIINDVQAFYTSQTIDALHRREFSRQSALGPRPGFEVYTVGPLLKFDDRCSVFGAYSRNKTDGIRQWLEDKARGSVVYVSMGSAYDLALQDLTELAHGLTLVADALNLFVLWAHRPVQLEPAANSGLDSSGLPAGWLEANTRRVKVCPWVDQLRVLQHPALGCFVTHAGWNSLLESVCVGHAPLVCVPLSFEQPANACVVEKYFEIGTRARKNPTTDPLERNRFAETIEDTLRNATHFRERLQKLQAQATTAWDNHLGSSAHTLRSLLDLIVS